MEKIMDYLEKLAFQLGYWDAQIEDLAKDARQLKKKEKKRIQEKIANLKEKKRTAQKKIDDLKISGVQAYATARENLEESWKDLKKTFVKARKEAKKENKRKKANKK